MALSDKDRDAAILRWETGKDADGNEAPEAQWEDGVVGGLPTRVRKKPNVDTLAALLARPDHMVRCSVDDAGVIQIEVEERADTDSKGDGVPVVYPYEPADKTAVMFRGTTIAKRVEIGQAEADRLAAIAAKEAAYTAEQLSAKLTYEEAQAELEAARKLAVLAGVEIDG